MTKSVSQNVIWVGTDSSWAEFLQVQEQVATRISAGWVQPEASTLGGDAPKLPYLMSKQNGLAIISISGPISSQANWYDEFLGSASYPAIREALVAAANDPEVKQILLDINSGGGAVNGVSDTGKLISKINAEVKPVTAYAEAMMSAAYWLGCSAGETYCSQLANVGSIGVIATHFEQSKMLADMGIGVTVIRSGKYKALASAVEPLSEAGKQMIQDQVDATSKIFVAHVADALSVTPAYVDSKLGQGRVFMGAEAVEVGLVTGVSSFDDLVSSLQAKIIDNNLNIANNSRNNSPRSNAMKTALSAQTPEVTGVAAAPAGTPAAPAGTPAAPAVEHTASAPVASEPISAVLVASDSELVEFLKGQVADKEAALLAANVELATLKANSNQGYPELFAFCAQSLNVMQVALGGTATDTSAMSATALLAEHKRVADQYGSTFKTGGVAAVSANVSKEPSPRSSLDEARLAAAGHKPVKT